MSMTKLFGTAALLAVLCVPAVSVAAENSSEVARPVLHADSGCSRSRTYHYHYHYRTYQPRVHFMPRHSYPRKKKTPPIGF